MKKCFLKKQRRFFPPSPATIFTHSLEVFSWNFGCVFETLDPQMCTFGLLGCRVKPRPRERKRAKMGEENEISGPPPHPSGSHSSAPPPFAPHFLRPCPPGLLYLGLGPPPFAPPIPGSPPFGSSRRPFGDRPEKGRGAKWG